MGSSLVSSESVPSGLYFILDGTNTKLSQQTYKQAEKHLHTHACLFLQKTIPLGPPAMSCTVSLLDFLDGRNTRLEILLS